MSFELPELPFEKEALGSWGSKETIDFHYGKHHAGYVSKLNAAIAETELKDKSLEEIIKLSRNDLRIFNNAAQHFNHSFFWNCLQADTSKPDGLLEEKIQRDFGSLHILQEEFTSLAGLHFGSGWAWLLESPEGNLVLKSYHDADTPADSDHTPILTLDVWEHAYYIDYRNDRKAFIDGFWDHINWKFAGDQLKN